jgi:hypothetical protein
MNVKYEGYFSTSSIRVQTLSSGALIRAVFSIFPNLFPHKSKLLKVIIKVNLARARDKPPLASRF